MKIRNVVLVLFIISINCFAENVRSATEIIQHNMQVDGCTNVYEFMEKYAIELSLQDSSDSVTNFIKLVKNNTDVEELRHVAMECMQNESYGCTHAEKERIAMLLAVKYSDFYCAKTITFSKHSMWLQWYLNQPYSAENLPQDIAEWEDIIYKIHRDEYLENKATSVASGKIIQSFSELSLAWLARYGESKKTKNLLLALAMDEVSFLRTVDYLIKGDRKKRILINGSAARSDYSSWIEWYVDEVIIPAGLHSELQQRIRNNGLYIEKIEKYLNKGQ